MDLRIVGLEIMRLLLCFWNSSVRDISVKQSFSLVFVLGFVIFQPLLISFCMFAALPSLKLAAFLCRKSMSSVLPARTGRHRQRYQDHFRLVAGCIPYKPKANTDNHSGDLMDCLEVLMISSPNRADLVFPKGGWEIDETVHQAACREALEEAGVRGIINETLLGVWTFRSKSSQNSCNLEGTCQGHMFALEVTEELQCWPEQASHERKWVTIRDAFEYCRYEWMREALKSFIQLMSGKTTLTASELPELPSFLVGKPTTADHAAIALC